MPISAKLVANLLSAAGTNWVLTMDLHKAQIQGFFDIPVDHLFAAPVIVEYCLRLQAEDLTIVSPDAGGAERAGVCEAARRRAGDCRQTAHGGRHGRSDERDRRRRWAARILQDDIIDTAGTIQKAADALKKAGAKRVLACAVTACCPGRRSSGSRNRRWIN